jgi:tetratricopeptide (TPR) repeat protein
LRVANSMFRLGAYPEQAEEIREVLAKAESELETSSASTVDMAWCVTIQARAELALGRPVEAAALARRAAELLRNTAGLAIANAYTVLGESCARLGRSEEAVTALSRAVEYLEKMEAHRPAARTWFELAELFGSAGQADGQKAAFERALSCMDL